MLPIFKRHRSRWTGLSRIEISSLRLTLRIAVVAGFLAHLGACATVTPTYEVKAFHAPTEAQHEAWIDAAYDTPSEEAKHVEMWMRGDAPAGVQVVEDGKNIKVSEAFEGQYKVIGEITVNLENARRWGTYRNVAWTWHYEEPWRRGLCWWQVPLRIATAALWSLVPLSYPCMASIPHRALDGAKVLMARSQAMAKAMGGNVVIFTGLIQNTYVEERHVGGGYVELVRRTKTDGVRALVIHSKLVPEEAREAPQVDATKLNPSSEGVSK